MQMVKKWRQRGLWGLLLLLPGLWFGVCYLRNERRLDQLEAGLERLPHPAGTRLVERTRFLGMQQGGGSVDCCQFQVTQVREMGGYPGSWQSLMSTYGYGTQLTFEGDAPDLFRYQYARGAYHFVGDPPKSSRYVLTLENNTDIARGDLRCFLLRPCDWSGG